MFAFNRSDFFTIKNILFNDNLESVLKDLVILKKVNSHFQINEISSLKYFKNNSVLFLDRKNKLPNYNFDNICIVTNNLELSKNTKLKNIYIVNDIDLSNNLILNNLYIHEDNIEFYDDFSNKNGSFISNSSKIDVSSKIYKNCVIGKGVTIGKNCIIKNNVVIKNAILGNNIIIGDNSTIGSTGFGFSLNNMGAMNISPQLGIVIIDDNVSIGSNCAIDRGKIDPTIIGKNSMLDNHVHIGHNVIINKNVCIAAQTGIAGSTEIGNNVVIGGQSGLAGHITIGDNVIIAGKSGVTKNIKKNSIVAGFPAVDIKEWKKNIINLKKYGHKQN